MNDFEKQIQDAIKCINPDKSSPQKTKKQRIEQVKIKHMVTNKSTKVIGNHKPSKQISEQLKLNEDESFDDSNDIDMALIEDGNSDVNYEEYPDYDPYGSISDAEYDETEMNQTSLKQSITQLTSVKTTIFVLKINFKLFRRLK
jgi:hypothetical protein